MQRVLLIGDSIRMFYQNEVEKILGENYKIMTPAENCRFSYYALNSLRFWLNDFKNPDIIHWNIGLWDLAILYHEDGCFISKDIYVANMVKILRELKKTGAKIIFATTTPVWDKKSVLEGPMPPAHRNEDIIAYNEAVLEAFRDEDIDINDLHSLIYEDRDKYISDDMIHPNPEGVQILGKAVAEHIAFYNDYKNPLYTEGDDKHEKRIEKTIQ